jgi:hypothetical protein
MFRDDVRGLIRQLKSLKAQLGLYEAPDRPLSEVERGLQALGPDLTAAALDQRRFRRCAPVGEEHLGINAGARGVQTPALVTGGVAS